MNVDYDAIVVGGRCAGAATAMLLARGGLRVLVIEASRPGTDTLSTHALMRGGVVQLARWGLLDDVVAAGTPAIRCTEFVYGGDTVETVDIVPGGGVCALRAPRRTLLDALLLDAARAAGAEVRAPARVTRVRTDGRRVCGVDGVERGAPFRATAPLTIGADGRRSTVASGVRAAVRRCGTASGAVVYGYFADLPRDRYRWAYRLGVTAGVIPTGQELACVWAGTSSARFRGLRALGPDLAHRTLLAEADPDVAESLNTAPVGAFRAFPGQPGWIRASAGPGWALVGDAGYYKDPITAHGITDALRDAELLARAVLDAPPGRRARLAALHDYERTRDQLSEQLFDVTERIAGYRWDLNQVREELRILSRVMRSEVKALSELDNAA